MLIFLSLYKSSTVEPLLTATSLQRPPLYNGHLFTTATFFRLGRRSIHSSRQRQRPVKRVPNSQNNLSITATKQTTAE